MKDLNALIYFSAICGFLAITAPTMSNNLMRLGIGIGVGYSSWQAWPLVNDILRQL